MKPSTQPRYTNALVDSASLYLKQHAHNPVMWHPWGDEAIQLAKQHNRPILLSIGYSSCYWCHVMEREVFENVSIASYMNEHFINIKLDREEYPLIDETYMVARQLISREGGWPNNVFLTSDLKPFYACGTHLLEDSSNRPGFQRLLEWVNAKWVSEQDEVEKQAAEVQRLTKRFLQLRKVESDEPLPLSSLVHTLTDQLLGCYDDIAGGFYKEPKFPHETYTAFLLQIGQLFQHKPAIDAAVHTLLKMASGGVYDQVGCGFHRYAVDRNWLVPHFEKMLYNQALCASLYIEATALTNNPYLSDIAQGMLEFVSGVMTSDLGSFYTAIDAETDGVEGAYYTWQAKEIHVLLSDEEKAFFNRYYALADVPHFPGHKKPTGQAIVLRQPLWQMAKDDGLPYIQLAALSGQIMNKLLNQRNQRQAPYLDDKIVTSWNGLMIKAYAEGYKQFAEEKFKIAAVHALTFFYNRYHDNGAALHHSYNKTTSVTSAVLEDYAYLTVAALTVHGLCKDNSKDWLSFARELLHKAQSLFYDAEQQCYQLSQVDDLNRVAVNHATDSNLPSAVGMLLEAYVRVYKLTDEQDYLAHAQLIKETYQPTVQPQAALEYCQLVGALSMLATVEKDTDFIEHTAILFRDAENVDDLVTLHAALATDAQIEVGKVADINIHISLKQGWHIEALNQQASSSKLDISGENVQSIQSLEFPEAAILDTGEIEKKLVYQGDITIKASILCAAITNRQPIEVKLTYQLCDDSQCYGKQQKSYKI